MYAATLVKLINGVAWLTLGAAEFYHISPCIKGGLAITAGLGLIFMAWLEEWGW